MEIPNEEGSCLPILHLNKYNADGSQVSLTSTSSLVDYTSCQLWQEPFPRSIFIRGCLSNSETNVSDNIDDESVDVVAFMDFILTPGRFAKIAIYNAFKVGSLLKLSNRFSFVPLNSSFSAF